MKKSLKFIYMVSLIFVGLTFYGQTTNYDSIKAIIESNYDFTSIDSSNENSYAKTALRWLEFYETRLDENGNVDGYIQNLNDYLEANKGNDGMNAHWEYIGHTDQLTYPDRGFHNQIVRIWVNPNNNQHILAGTLMNGLWETYDKGDNWSCITDNEPKIRGITSIEVKTSGNNTTIYVASCADASYPPPYSIGLFYTDDDGETWHEQDVIINGNSRYPTAPAKYAIRQWMHYSSSIQFLLTNNYLYRSDDGGTTFQQVIYKDPEDYANGLYNAWQGGNVMRKMLVNPYNTNELFISGPELLKYNINSGVIENLTDNLKNGIVDEIFMTDMAKSKINNNIIWFMGAKLEHIDGEDYFDISMVKYSDDTKQYQYFGPYDNEDAMYFRMFETSPFDDDNISFGNRGNDFYNVNNGFTTIGHYIHFDIRASVLVKENNKLVQFQGTDGGIGKVTFPGTVPVYSNVIVEDITNDGTNGIINYNMNSFDVSTGTEDDMMLMACSDNSTIFERNNEWDYIFPFNGDGYYCQFSKEDPTIAYSTEADYNMLFSLNTSSVSNKGKVVFIYDEASKVPGFRRSFVIEPDNSKIIYTGQVNQIIKLLVNDDFIGSTSSSIDITPYNKNVIPQFFATRSNSDYFYLCTNGKIEGAITEGPMLLKVSDDLSEVTDMTASVLQSINNKKWTPVTSIALDPYNTNRFWISLGAISEIDKVYVTNNDGTSFEPMGDGLPTNFPVNELVLDETTNMLFAATDVGIYFYDENNSVWTEITGDMPPVFCNFVRFSPDHKNIRLGSKSRGPWETSYCFYDENNPLTINSDVTWDNPKFAFQDIIIESGATLTIKNNVFMPSEAKIIVKRGAQLIIDGGTLTNACDDLWKGVEVWGTYNQPQSLVYQGLVRVQNGGKIENAYYGIRTIKATEDQTGEGEILDMTYTGGIVWADNSKFYNNKIAVRFYAYDNTSTSHFNDCYFSLYGDLLSGEQPNYLVKMSRMTGIVFTNCDFSRNDTENQFVGSGIYAYDSKFTVEGKCLSSENPCTDWDYGAFRQLKYGIYVINNSISNKYPDIRHQDFSLNRSAVYIGTTDGARVTSNNFSLPQAPLLTDKNYYGIYLDRSTKYHVEDNRFEGPEPDFGYIGVYVNESGDSWNQIYNNTFRYLYYGTMAYGDNRKDHETGLCIKCNDYDHNKNDITVNGENPKYDGIAYNQGFLGPNDTLPAGNTFTKDQNIVKYNYYNSEKCGFIDYVYHGSSQGNEQLNPTLYYSTETMFKHPNNQVEYIKSSACPSKLEEPGGGGGTDGDREAMAQADSHILQSKAQLDALVDGGNTGAVTLDVITSTPPQGGEVYQDLMGKSPYLSDTVMKTAIKKENVLPNAMVRDILVANPQAAKEKDVINSVDERFDPMPQWMKDQILQGVSVTGAKESIEADIARWTSVREEHFNNIYQFYRKNYDDNPAYYDSLVMLLDTENTLEAKYKLAFLYLDNGDAYQATGLLNSLPSQFEMTTAEQTEYQQYENLFGILTQLDETGIPDSAQIAQLQLIEQNNQGYPGAFARSMLIEAGAIDYVEPVIIPDELKSSSAISNFDTKNGFEQHEPLRVFPNPAKDYIIVDYDTQGKTGAVLLSITDMKGNFKEKQVLNLNRDQRVISTKQWKAGVYIVTVSVNGTALKSVKVTVQ